MAKLDKLTVLDDISQRPTVIEQKFSHYEMEIKALKGKRVHRLGRGKHGKPPLIVAKFTRYKDREMVRKLAATKLRGKDNFSIFEQFPKIIQERRKILIPKLKEAKRKQMNAKLVVDKLHINGRIYDHNEAFNLSDENFERQEQRQYPIHR
ncbi:hypothetical protein KUTeg_011149 [Tegillarca granosa]|uniref:Uncharacterized protein n=1 Tax=Tegillarca granosa TaxID=220873 RepID=A0ABQ9F4T2_TEGGR|nr:hypothetical protein KUTeg_011149 [Tegillarca granosa]